MNKNYYNDLPIYVKKLYPEFQYNKCFKILKIQYENCYQKFNDILVMYVFDNDFYIITKSYIILMWIDTKTYTIIKKR